jgi:HEAT repeat protein
MATLAPLAMLALVAGDLAWPGALEADGRALAAVPEADRPAAIDELVERHGVKAAAPYLAPLLADPEPEVRVYVGRLLVRAGDARAADAALAWLTAPGRPAVDRTFGLDLLSRGPALAPPARRAIEQAIRDRDAGVRMRALEALGRQEINPSLPAVLGALDDESREVRLQAVLLTVAAARENPPAAALATLPLIERLGDPDRLIQIAAIRALGALRDPRALQALLRLATTPQTIELRTAAADALGAPAMAAATPALAGLARRAPADELARHAALALGAIATPSALSALAGLLRAPPVLDEVKVALRQAGPTAVAPLAVEVARGTPASAALAAQLLGEIGDRRATAALAAAVDAPLHGMAVVLVAIRALGRLADPAGLPTLARAAAAPYPDVRRAAFAALEAIGDPRASGAIGGGLADGAPGVRAAAAALAGALGARGAATALADRLADADPGVRRAAARALARLPTLPGAIGRMLAALAPAKVERDDDELEALGDALEAQATAADAAPIEAAFLAAPPPLVAPLGRALAAAHVETPLVGRAAVARALAQLDEGGGRGAAAADLLAAARLSDDDVPRLARAFADAEPPIRAALCAALALAPGGGRWLAAVLADPQEPAAVRAAAAWSARDLPEARGALEVAARGPDGPVAGNARAALAAAGRPGRAWAAVRLRATDGAAIVGRWVTLTAAGLEVRALTDAAGVARVAGLAIPAAWSAAGLSLRAAP